jgi:uncharacterized repeat protein (TIGR03803 family)
MLLTCAPLLADTSGISPLTTLHAFGAGDDGGPYERLIRASDGAYYGTTPSGGANGGGAVFRVTPDGSYERIHDFIADVGGLTPWGGVIQASDSNLYGTTQNGGAFNHGVVYRLSLDGQFAVIHHFNTSQGFDQGFSTAALVQASDGNLYGTTSSGIGGAVATIFRIGLGGQFTTLHQLTSFNEGSGLGALVQGTDGNLYGTASFGGNAACNGVGCGSLFRMSLAGDFEVVHHFTDGADGRSPADGLLVAGNDGIYGAAAGGTHGAGVLFRYTTSEGYRPIHAFSGADGASPNGGLVQDGSGKLYGTTYAGGGLDAGTVFSFARGEVTTLHAFSYTDGQRPRSGGVLDGAGNLYGGTFDGGRGNDGVVFRLKLPSRGPAPSIVAMNPGSGIAGAGVLLQGTNFFGATAVRFGGTGAAFQVLSPTRILATVPPSAVTGEITVSTPDGGDSSAASFTVVPSHQVLSAFDGSDGSEPLGGLLAARDGNFYGVTYEGGSSGCSGLGCGTLFAVSPNGTRTTLHVFGGDDGALPAAALTEGTDGSLYGTTSSGGALQGGTVFRFQPQSAVMTVLHSFRFQSGIPPPDAGWGPAGQLRVTASGVLFGTTELGGSYSDELCPSGCGTVFRLTPDDQLTTLHRFTNDANGAYPVSPLTRASDGALYGTTYTGIYRVTRAGAFEMVHVLGFDEGFTPGGLLFASDGLLYGTTSEGQDSEFYGTIFSLSTAGDLTTLFLFHANDASAPDGPLLEASDGRLYGVTGEGGVQGSGTVYRFDPAKAEKGVTTLHEFDVEDGALPDGALVQGADGALYGVTEFGGTASEGTIYRLSVQAH